MTLSELFPAMDTGPTPDPAMVAFASGAAGLECLVAGLFFLRFWQRTGERLFIAFAFAFWLLGANAALPVLLGRPAQMHGEVYLLRLAAFLLIILAIAGKNLKGRKG
ncbi:MAG TPA: DUF5985 family protein [Caulobacteraceae bacterium]|jgi:hypothetical protein